MRDAVNEKGSWLVLARGAAALGLAALAAACGSTVSLVADPGPGQSPGRIMPTVTTDPAPALGSMSYGTFPATTDGLNALTVCEQWAGLRAEYVALVRADTPYQLEQWFSGPQWRAAFAANSPLKADPAYGAIDTAFELVSTGTTAGIASARLLDAACAAAD